MNLQRTGAPIVVTRTGRRPLARFQHIRPPVGCNIIFVVINRGAMRLATCSCLGEGCRSGQLEGRLTLGHCKWLRFDNRDSFTHMSMGSNLFSICEGIQDGNKKKGIGQVPARLSFTIALCFFPFLFHVPFLPHLDKALSSTHPLLGSISFLHERRVSTFQC